MSLDSRSDPHVSEEVRLRVSCGELSNRFTATLPLWSPGAQATRRSALTPDVID